MTPQEKWKVGLIKIKNRNKSFFETLKAACDTSNEYDIEDFLLIQGSGKYNIISVCGMDLPDHIKKEVNELAISIFPQV